MSGPLSNNEIEDVVSSVRRLVSADGRPRTVSRDLGQDKLILTPAFRVVPEDTPPDPLVLTAPLIEPAAETEGPVSHLVEADWEDEIWHEEPAPLAELALGAEEAELVVVDDGPPLDEIGAALPGDALDEFEDDEPATVVPLLRAVDPTPRDAVAEPETDAALAADSLPDPLPDAPDPVPVDTAPGVTTLDEVQTLVDKDGNPLTVLDEEALQEIVRSLIREELQGVLGERITHNVRKLVRSEINRALTARALD